MVSDTRPPDRRQSVRFSTDRGTRFQLTIAGDHLFYPARIREISQGGVKLVGNRHLEPGMVIKVMVTQPVMARVAHATPLAEGTWALGLALAIKLNQAELQSWLEDSAALAQVGSSAMAQRLQS